MLHVTAGPSQVLKTIACLLSVMLLKAALQFSAKAIFT